MTDLNANKKLVQSWFEAVNGGDVERLMSLLADDLDYWVAGDWQMGGRHTKVELRQMMIQVAQSKMWDKPLTLTPVAFTAEGERVAVEATSTGSMKGKDYAQTYHMLFVVKNGKVAILREYLDTKHAFEFFSS